MRRTAIFILLCLLFGALMSVAVAWWATLKEWEDPETTAIEHNGWKAGVAYTPATTLIRAIHVDQTEYALKYYGIQARSAYYTETLPPSWFSLSTKPANQNAIIRGIGAGWPLTCVVFVQELGGETVFQEWDFVTHGGIVGTNPFDSEAEYVWSRNHLPLRIVPTGLFVDALIYGAGFAFPVLVVLLNLRLRAKHHQRHKRCPRCKYDLSRATSTVCPECGADARSLPILISRRTVSVSSWLCAVLLFTVIGFGAAFVSQPPYSRLHHAAYVGDIEEVRDQLEAGEDIDLAAPTNDVDTWYVFTPLALAAYRGHIEIVQLLIESGADLEEQSWFGFTALHLSIEGGSKDCVAMLLKAGADVNAVTDFNSDAISQTAIPPEYDQELLDILLEAGYRIEPHSKQTDLAFVLALDRENDQFIHRLFELGAVPGYRALQGAVRAGQVDWLELFVRNGADLGLVSIDGWPILHAVSPDEKPREIVEFLIQHGQHIDSADGLGVTGLMVAAELESADLCRIFLDFGADPNLRDDSGMNALDHAIEFRLGNIEGLVSVLLDAGAEVRLVDEKGEPRFEDLDSEILKLLQEKAASNSKKNQPGQ